MQKLILLTTLLAVGLIVAGCNNSNDKTVDAANKMMEDAQKQNAKLMDAATDQMKAGTEMMKAATDSVKQQTDAANTPVAKTMDGANKSIQDAQQSPQK
ncbi:MAG TPA: hypothetical protein VFE46_14910 [Pirellulales bacterium]|jgi:uncharacterized lipoprotein NlpE involved in copper resistance|nr:hypothetical protein [Pirellulales bacterium]